MADCKNCFQKILIPSKSNRKKKYCSKKCANQYLEKYYPNGEPRLKTSKKAQGWVPKYKQEEIKRKENKELYEELCKTHLNALQIAEMAGWKSTSIVSYKASKLGIKGIKIPGHGVKMLYTDEQAKRIINEPVAKPQEIPEGYISGIEAYDILYPQGTCGDDNKTTQVRNLEKRLEFDLAPIERRVANASHKMYFEKSKVLELKELFNDKEQEKRELTRSRELAKKLKDEELETFNREHILLRDIIDNQSLHNKTLMNRVVASKNVDDFPSTRYLKESEVKSIYKDFLADIKKLCKTKPGKTACQGKYISTKDISKVTKLIKDTDTRAEKIYNKNKEEEIERNKQARIARKAPRLKDQGIDRNSEEYHEKKAMARLLDIKDEVKRLAEEDSCKKNLRRWESLQLNLEYAEDEAPVTFTCTKCKEVKEYYRFQINLGGPRGRRLNCRTCEKKRDKARRHRQVELAKERYKKPEYKIKILVQCSAQGYINKANGKHIRTSAKEIWEAIEEQCGWKVEDLKEHIEKQFTSEMNWDNWCTPTEPGEFGWHLDHIEPQGENLYTSTKHPNFKKMWSLENLRPIGSRMNVIKSSKSSRDSDMQYWRKGIFKYALDNKSYKRGPWKYFDYDVFQAKEHIELTFEDGFTWDNYGEVWEIDHIIPMVEFPYQSHSEDNFRKVWSLDNMTALSKSKNRTKSGLHNGEKKLYNDIDKKPR